MSDPRPSRPPDLGEAAAWYAKLGNRSVTTQTLRDFREWRRDPANDAAYQEIEATWTKAGAIADSPDIMRATEEALAYRPRTGRNRWLRLPRVAWAVAFASFALVAGAIFSLGLLTPTYSTGVGEQRLVRLADGSRVRLNTDSKVRVTFSKAERHLALERGEAFFDVAHDAQRPFIVEAGDARVRALGTRFDVRRDRASVAVTLVEGRVHVQQDDRGRGAMLVPNQQVTVSKSGVGAARSADATRLTSWTTGRLVFHETPLSAAIAEVNRYADHKVQLESDAVAGHLVNGVFDVGDTDSFVRGVSELFDLRATRSTEGDILLRPATPDAT